GFGWSYFSADSFGIGVVTGMSRNAAKPGPWAWVSLNVIWCGVSTTRPGRAELDALLELDRDRLAVVGDLRLAISQRRLRLVLVGLRGVERRLGRVDDLEAAGVVRLARVAEVDVRSAELL